MMISVTFQSGEETLRGSLHLPIVHERPVPGLLILPGFADTAVGPHNMHVCMARALMQEGYALLRFDYAGLGESDGDFRRFTASTAMANVQAALHVLQSNRAVDTTRLGVIGFSLGGALACELAARVSEIRALALLAPVAYPTQVFRTFFSDEQLRQGEAQGWIDWLGWPVGQAYLPSLTVLDPLAALRCSQAKALVLHGTHDSEVPIDNAEAYAACAAQLHWLAGGDHQFSSVFLQEQAIQRVTSWFQQYISTL
jgi:uncharacterized protein